MNELQQRCYDAILQEFWRRNMLGTLLPGHDWRLSPEIVYENKSTKLKVIRPCNHTLYQCKGDIMREKKMSAMQNG